MWNGAEKETVKEDTITKITGWPGEHIMIERTTVYYEKPGKENTENTLRIAKAYADASGIKDVVVASTTGETGAAAAALFKGYNVIVVTHHASFSESGVQELTEENRKRILENGARVFTGTHALSGVERDVRRRFGTMGPLELIANTLRLMGEGTKVCAETVVMAADAGLISVGADVIAVAGTGHGADTALVIKPANASKFFDLSIREVVVKPREF